MNKREVAEIRRRFKPNHNALGKIRGCYVNELGHISSQFVQPITSLTEEETGLFFDVVRKTMSGKLGKNLFDLELPTKAVADSHECKLLRQLRDSGLADDDAVQELYQQIIEAKEVTGDYLILLVHDRYDVPHRTKGGDEQMDDASDEVFTYIMCSICPVKDTKQELSYKTNGNELRNRFMDKLVKPPATGFMYPAFTERATDLYHALGYTRDATEGHVKLFQNVFGIQAPLSADTQKQLFHEAVKSALDKDFDFTTYNAIREHIDALIDIHKEAKVKEPLTLDCPMFKSILKECGATKEQTDCFEEKFTASFGKNAEISPNVLDTKKKLELKVPDITIKANPDGGDLIKTQIINGHKYVLIRADEGIEVNGIPIDIN